MLKLQLGQNTLNATGSAKRVYVPLQFWFCRNPGLALPLIALQYHEVKVNLTTRPLNELFTVDNGATLGTGSLHANSMLTTSTLILMKEEDSLKYHTNTLLNKFNSLVMNQYLLLVQRMLPSTLTTQSKN